MVALSICILVFLFFYLNKQKQIHLKIVGWAMNETIVLIGMVASLLSLEGNGFFWPVILVSGWSQILSCFRGEINNQFDSSQFDT